MLKRGIFSRIFFFFFASAIPSCLLESSSLFLIAKDVFNFHSKCIYVLPKYFVLLLLLLRKKKPNHKIESFQHCKNILLRKDNCGTSKGLAWMTFAERIFTLQPLLALQLREIFLNAFILFFAHCPAFSCNSYFSSWYLVQCCILGL